MIRLNLGFLPLVSDNKLKYTSGRYTTKARILRDEVNAALYKHRRELKLFREDNLPWIEREGIAIKYTLIHSKFKFFKKDGGISIRKGDATNYLKALNDFIFNPSRIIQHNIQIDDKYIIECNIKQQYSTSHPFYKNHDAIYVILEIDGAKDSEENNEFFRKNYVTKKKIRRKK